MFRKKNQGRNRINMFVENRFKKIFPKHLVKDYNAKKKNNDSCNYNKSKKIYWLPDQGRQHRGRGWVEGMPPPPHTQTFLRSKKKNGNKGKTRKSFKAETIKKLSPRSKCYCFSHSRASRIQKLFCRPTMMADSTFQCSVASPI